MIDLQKRGKYKACMRIVWCCHSVYCLFVSYKILRYNNSYVGTLFPLKGETEILVNNIHNIMKHVGNIEPQNSNRYLPI